MVGSRLTDAPGCFMMATTTPFCSSTSVFGAAACGERCEQGNRVVFFRFFFFFLVCFCWLKFGGSFLIWLSLGSCYR